MLPKNQALSNLDFEANRENAMSENLANYRILHFATHGLLDTAHPEFSGLVFSLYDKNGKSQDGYLRLNQIYNLNLNSDLVVLSACQTALGRDVRGEGLIGLRQKMKPFVTIKIFVMSRPGSTRAIKQNRFRTKKNWNLLDM